MKTAAILLITGACAIAAGPPVSDFAWLTGSWHTEVWGGSGDEVWMAPAANTMFCVWRYTKDGKLVFSELAAIESDPQLGVVMRLKHFNPGMKGWEEKDDSVFFKLASHDGRDILFQAEVRGQPKTLRYRLTAENRLEVIMRETGRDGQPAETRFFFERIRN